VIISGGKKVSLDDMERQVSQLPEVESAMAVAVDSEWGQSPGLLMVLKDSSRSEGFALDVELAVKPAKVKIVEALPVLSSGKPDYMAATATIKD